MERRPNIVFMISDDHRSSSIHAYGNAEVRTDNLDRLVANGVSFSNAYIMGSQGAAVCAPSRASIHTGVNPMTISQHPGDSFPGAFISPRWDTLGATLRASGYYTYAVGKWHNDPASFNRSFTNGTKLFFGGMSDHYRVPLRDFDPSGRYSQSDVVLGSGFSSEIFADAAVEFLQTYQGEQPYFLYVAFTAPHDPRTPPEPYRSMYRPADIPLPKNFYPEHPFDNGEMTIRDEQLAPWPRTEEAVRQHLADYYGMISHMDSQIGRILSAISQDQSGTETLIIYVADHGLAVGSHGLLGKQNLYEHSIKVPLIISGDGLPKGKKISTLVYSYDLFPAICDLVDAEIPPSVESQSLVPLMTGLKQTGRSTVCAAYKDLQRMVTDGEWKLIRYYRSPESQTGEDRLQVFHIGEDPYELDDLWASGKVSPAVVTRLVDELKRWQEAVGDPLVSRKIEI